MSRSVIYHPTGPRKGSPWMDTGKLLTINLTTEEIEWADFPGALARRFLGGRGINAWLLAEHIGPGTDPLGPENILMLSCGLLTGTRVPSSSRLHVGARSPLTGLLGSSNVGGHFGAGLRAAGVNTLLIQGHARRPVTLRIDDDEVELRDATHLWGLDSRTATGVLQAESGEAVKLAVIGVGGENLVRYACIMTGDGHAAGRTGLGAVKAVQPAPRGRPGGRRLAGPLHRGARQRSRPHPRDDGGYPADGQGLLRCYGVG